MREKSIIWAIDHLGMGGTQQVLKLLIAHFARCGYSQKIICLNNIISDSLKEEIDTLQIQILVVGKWQLLVGFGIPLLFYWLIKEKPRVLVSFLFFSDVITLPIARFTRVPTRISSVRANNLNYSDWQHWLLRKSIKNASLVTCNSKWLITYIEQHLRVSKDKVIVLPNPVEIEFGSNRSRNGSLRNELEIPEGAVLIGSCGRLTRQKGYDCLLEAVRMLHDNVHLVVFGEGKQRNNLIRQAISLGISNRVYFPGYKEDIQELFNSVDIYAQTSRFEGMPNALMEAMAHGCVVVGSGVDGIAELLGNDERGWLVPSTQPSILAHTIQKALENKNESSRRAELARTFVRTRYGKDKSCSTWESAITNADYQMIQSEVRD